MNARSGLMSLKSVLLGSTCIRRHTARALQGLDYQTRLMGCRDSSKLLQHQRQHAASGLLSIDALQQTSLHIHSMSLAESLQ